MAVCVCVCECVRVYGGRRDSVTCDTGSWELLAHINPSKADQANLSVFFSMGNEKRAAHVELKPTTYTANEEDALYPLSYQLVTKGKIWLNFNLVV